MNELIYSIGKALDVVEGELLGASTYHSARVAVLSAAMGTYFEMGIQELIGLTTCALLHDNALTEYIHSERETGPAKLDFYRLHCQYGQRNVNTLPLDYDISTSILYHHERADGKGPFGKKETEIPLHAQIIGIANHLDVQYHLQHLSLDELSEFKEKVIGNTRGLYTKKCIHALQTILTEDVLTLLRDENIEDSISNLIPIWEPDVKNKDLINMVDFIANIIDYKSFYTRNHTTQIANRIWIMTNYYGFDEETSVKLYLAAALHDIGKLYIPTEILEKPGKLNKDEYETIMKHVWYTYKHLNNITGFEDICRWASSHHEKLDGSGYPFGKTAKELDFPSRLLACIDIYQAVCEERPYHPRRNHIDTMSILYGMAEQGKIDTEIVKDLDIVMAPYSKQDVPGVFKQIRNNQNH